MSNIESLLSVMLIEPDVAQDAVTFAGKPAMALADHGENVQSVAVPLYVKSSELNPNTSSLKVIEKRISVDWSIIEPAVTDGASRLTVGRSSPISFGPSPRSEVSPRPS